jgi:hypothetical protein
MKVMKETVVSKVEIMSTKGEGSKEGRHRSKSHKYCSEDGKVSDGFNSNDQREPRSC